jgi:hypothetical protein
MYALRIETKYNNDGDSGNVKYMDTLHYAMKFERRIYERDATGNTKSMQKIMVTPDFKGVLSVSSGSINMQLCGTDVMNSDSVTIQHGLDKYVVDEFETNTLTGENPKIIGQTTITPVLAHNFAVSAYWYNYIRSRIMRERSMRNGSNPLGRSWFWIYIDLKEVVEYVSGDSVNSGSYKDIFNTALKFVLKEASGITTKKPWFGNGIWLRVEPSNLSLSFDFGERRFIEI